MSLKPLSLLPSTLLFVLLGVNFSLLYYLVFPWLIEQGWFFWHAFYLVTLIGFLPLPVIAWRMLKQEQSSWSWPELKARLRLHPLTLRHWGFTLVGLVVTLAGYLGLLFTVRWVYNHFGTLPLWYLDPEITIAGLYGLILWRIVVIFINVVGEEVLWRGVIQPRQELQHGKKTWMIHGLQWLSFYSWKPWEWLMLLPSCLILPWISQKTQSMTPALVIHAVFNGLGIVMFTLAVVKG
ncbi:CPBP family intramembrane glutamic endopeptidase [Rheinheimera baltica]|uniref:CPBP family intramembrane glutamic endopeptidase n=1 Tax=Rheinheimera baltica TaxID=67576 RepID=UPI00040FFF1B|nr:CPBP family intramembrane glutamic endopeptidase [Rheinheimera baltica]